MLTTSDLKRFLMARDLRLTKRLGQHHLTDAGVAGRIVAACALGAHDTVVEIGAGLGALTELLAERAGHVIAVEVDRGICDALRVRMADTTHVTVTCEDILQFAWTRVAGAVVVGTIPYHITAPILVALSEHANTLARVVIVCQAEVAQRLGAAPGTKTYGRLSLLAQYRWEVQELFRVPRGAFYPQPTVDSTCLRLVSRPMPTWPAENEQALFTLVKAAFSERRKTLANCLSGKGKRWDRPAVERVLQELGLRSDVRGEALSLEQFVNLSNALQNMGQIPF